MTTNGAKTFAMNEATHILELMEKLLSMDKEKSPTDYYSLESELYSHFTNISGLLQALQAIGDDETKKMVEELEEKKKILMRIRENENQKNDIEDSAIDNIGMENLNSIENLDEVNNETSLDQNETERTPFCNSSMIYAAFILVILVIAWMYFNKTD